MRKRRWMICAALVCLAMACGGCADKKKEANTAVIYLLKIAELWSLQASKRRRSRLRMPIRCILRSSPWAA